MCTVRLSRHISRLWGRHGVRYDAVVDDEAADATKFSYSVRFRRKRTYPYMHGLRTYAYAVGVDFVCLIRYDIALHPARYGTTVPTFLPHMAWHGMYTPAYSCVHCSASIYMYPDTQQTEFPVQSSSPELPHPFWIGINVPIPTNKKHEKKSPRWNRETHRDSCSFFFKKSRERQAANYSSATTVPATALLSEPAVRRGLAAVQLQPLPAAASPSPIARPTAPDSDQ